MATDHARPSSAVRGSALPPSLTPALIKRLARRRVTAAVNATRVTTDAPYTGPAGRVAGLDARGRRGRVRARPRRPGGVGGHARPGAEEDPASLPRPRPRAPGRGPGPDAGRERQDPPGRVHRPEARGPPRPVRRRVRRPHREAPDGRRAACLQAARELLEEDGSAALSLRAVARRAGVSATAPYRHYADRDALVSAVAVAYVRFALDHPALFRVMFAEPCDPGSEERVSAAIAVWEYVCGIFRSAFPHADPDVTGDVASGVRPARAGKLTRTDAICRSLDAERGPRAGYVLGVSVRAGQPGAGG